MKRIKKNDKTTTISGYLIISENGKLAIARRQPKLKGGEIACILEVTLPKDVFEFHYPNVKLTIDDTQIFHAPLEVRAQRVMDKL